MTSSMGESFPITKENVAAILALIGKEEQNTKSPTAIVMLSNLKNNLKVLFDKLCSRELDFAMVRMGGSIQQDDVYWEYASVPKTGVQTKTQALAQAINSIQQHAGKADVSIEYTDETSTAFEFLAKVRSW